MLGFEAARGGLRSGKQQQESALAAIEIMKEQLKADKARWNVKRKNRKPPKLGRVVELRFWSLRSQLGASLGVIHDCDTTVKRRCRRVLCDEGWKWQIVNAYAMSEWDWYVETDQDCLDEIGMDYSDIAFNQGEERCGMQL